MPNTIQPKTTHSFGLISIWGRYYSYFRLVQYFFMFASVPMLAYGLYHYDFEIVKTIIFTVISLYSGFFAAIIWNDICDADIDAIAHPSRALPAGKITYKKYFLIALLFSASAFIFSFLVSIWCLLLVGAAALFVTFHNKYLKKKVKFPAYSELFTPMQWLVVPIFGYLAISGSNYLDMILLVIFTYFADNGHDLPEGIHDVDGDHKLGVKTYATSFGEKTAARISLMMFIIAGIIGIVLFFRTFLTFVFLIPFLITWLYTLYISCNFLKNKEEDMRKQGRIVGNKTFRFFWLTYDFIFLDLLVQIIFLS